jgi:integrase
LRDHQNGIAPPPASQTVRSFLTEWLETTAKPRLRPRTFIGYRQHVEAHIVPALGTLRLHALCPQQVQAMFLGLQVKRLSPSTIRGVRAVLRAALGDALRWGLVGRNAAALAHGPRVQRPELKVFSTEQAQRFLQVIKGERLEAFFCTAVATGLRLGELLGLRWSDVDLDGGSLTVRQALQRQGKEVRFVEPKSKQSRRRLNLPMFAVSALTHHRDRQVADRRLAGSRWIDTGLVFTSSIGTALDERNVRRSFKEVLRGAELPDLRLHDLRHTTATLLLTQGVHPRVVMETLGHSQVSLTLDTYSHVLPGLQAEAARRLEDAIGCQIGCQEENGAPPNSGGNANSLEEVVSLNFASWNQLDWWLRQVDQLRRVA